VTRLAADKAGQIRIAAGRGQPGFAGGRHKTVAGPAETAYFEGKQ